MSAPAVTGIVDSRPAPVQVEHEGFTVRSNGGTVEDLQRELGVEQPDPTTQPETLADGADAESSTDTPESKVKAGDVHKRIAKTTYEREEANRRAEAAEQRARDAEARAERLERERTERPREEQRQPEPSADEKQQYERWKAGHDDADPKPQVEQFETHDAYLDARDDWNERRIDRKQQRAHEERQHFERHQAIGRAAGAFKTRIDTEAKKDPAFGQMVQKIQIPGEGPLFDVFINPKTPVEALVRHFDQHPEELSELIGMRPGWQLAEIHRLIGKIEARAEAAQAGSATREKPTTKAHPPINPVAGSPVAASDEEPGDDASDEAWFAYQERQRKARR